MRITDQKSLGSVNGARGGRGAGAASGARFTVDMGGAGVAKSESLAPTSILGGLEALIALQSGDTSRERRRRSVRRGQGMLDLLDELKIALLAGHLPPDMHRRLAAMLNDALPSGDPTLDAIMDGIELRAAVELAKLRQAREAAREAESAA